MCGNTLLALLLIFLLLIIKVLHFNFKQKIIGKAVDGGIKDVEILMPLKYLSKFWRNLEMPLFNCKINLILNWFENCVISSAVGNTKFKIIYTKVYVSVVTLSTQNNA